jgi:hypothetical protein
MKLIVASLLVLIAVAPLARAQYTFGTEVSSNPGSANESYNSGTKTFIVLTTS